ncbi:disease resistance protein SUMM2-like [Pistacia vera]|uniref:disease resistance protein SUMM2-like n=1 Tax=Pistacia vera TaxID=55513 RepID=UPI001263C01E|nr:disease resistance protein SUMM2-like [Pistacia vera]
MELLGTFLDILKCIGPPLCTYIEYHRKLQENFSNLKRELNDLNSRKKDVEEMLKAEYAMGKLPKEEVSNWLRNIETITGEVENIEKEVHEKKIFSRVRLSKLVKEKIQKVKEYEQKRSSFQSLVIDTPPARGLTLPTTTLVGANTQKNMEEIWAHLMGNEVTKIGVCGIGGVGKTTIIKRINNRLLQEKGKFDHVIWVTVSQPFDLAKLQDQIASMFDPNFKGPEDQKIRAAMLLRMFAGKRFVLILDDMWESFSLEEVGIPEPTKGNGCKVMITTRSIDVCHSMGCKVVRVEPLAKHEALKLFVDKVEVYIIEVPTLKELVELIVDQCACLPLAVVTVAGCMKGVDDICEWRNAFNELSDYIRSDKVLSVISRLQFSYDRLKHKKLQHCFLYCALYPEDFKIPKEELIDYWIAEGLVDERARMQAMYDEGYSILNRLVNNCLLESSDDGRCVKMHDLIREMALYITSMSPLFMVKAGEKLQELPREQEWKQNLGKASLMRNEISEIPPNMSPDCQALSTLLLQENVYLENIPESFFVRMQGLKILNLSYTSIEKLPNSVGLKILNLSYTSIEKLLNSISYLTNLTALLLQYCIKLKHVPCLAKLVCLWSLDLGGTIITEVPQGMEMLQKLRYFNLFSKELEKLPVGMLSKLSCVKKLRVYWGSKTSEATIEEASKLSELDTLEVCFHKVEDFKIHVKSLGSGGPRLRKYSLSLHSPLVGLKHTPYVSYVCYLFWPPVEEVDVDRNVVFALNFVAPPKYLQCLSLIACDDVRSLSDVLSNEEEYSDLKVVYISNCHNLKKLLSAKLLWALPNLEVIGVRLCEEIEGIITLDGGEEKSEEDGRSNTMGFTLALPKLKLLRLWDLPELKRICSSNGVMVCDSLKQIEVYKCPKLKRLPLSLSLPAIKEIKVEEDWWNPLEWDNPNAKNALQPHIKYW